MKRIVYLFSLLISLSSCEKADDNPHNLQTDFNHKILGGYFVKSIAFDSQGNACIGTGDGIYIND